MHWGLFLKYFLTTVYFTHLGTELVFSPGRMPSVSGSLWVDLTTRTDIPVSPVMMARIGPVFICFDKHELMVREHRPSDSVAALGKNARVLISPLTLGVFQDLGFDVDMRCADYDIMLFFPQCRRGGRGPSKWRRNRERKKTQYRSRWKGRRDLTLKQYFQILRYEFWKDLTTCRKQILRFGRVLKRTRKKATKLWIPNVQRNCRKTYRRIRRVTRKNIRGASPALQWE